MENRVLYLQTKEQQKRHILMDHSFPYFYFYCVKMTNVRLFVCSGFSRLGLQLRTSQVIDECKLIDSIDVGRHMSHPDHRLHLKVIFG